VSTLAASSAPLVLGSASPRRREMIAWLGLPFVVRTAAIDESVRDREAPLAYLERVAQRKLEAVRALDLGPARGVLVADTVVVPSDGAILGKPGDDAEAAAMILRLAATTHVVCTRFVLADPGAASPARHAQTVTTHVTFRAVSEQEAAAYAATGEGRDKAGAYGVQGRAAAFIDRLEGSYTNVVGLPLSEVVVAMRTLGWM